MMMKTIDKELTKKDIIQRTCLLVKALMMGYEYKWSNGMVIALDDNFNVFIKGQREIRTPNIPKGVEETTRYEVCWLPGQFELDIKHIQKEVIKLSEERIMEISSFVTLNKEKYETV